MFPFERGDANFRAQGRLGIRDRDHAMQIVPLAFKEGMLLHVQNHIQVAGRAAVKSAFSVAREADARTIFDSGGNFRVNSALAQDPAFAFALGTRMGNYAPCALACGTGALNTEEALLIADL